jgi:putative tricarboxylic transport membrane protein
MRLRVLSEGMVLIFFGCVGIFDSARMLLDHDYHYDMGSTHYLLGVSIALTIVGVVHIYSNLRLADETLGTTRESLKLAIKVVIILAVSILLMEFVGYFPATAVLFLLMFKAFGIASWAKNVILTITASASFYVIFVYILGMSFPKGMFVSLF